ncbi:MAG TPA: hypothetical protein PKD31_16355, partial [Blastocatellia bacterium]|nr:hypothetical protein [Blastocatellia bacterium]
MRARVFHHRRRILARLGKCRRRQRRADHSKLRSLPEIRPHLFHLLAPELPAFVFFRRFVFGDLAPHTVQNSPRMPNKIVFNPYIGDSSPHFVHLFPQRIGQSSSASLMNAELLLMWQSRENTLKSLSSKAPANLSAKNHHDKSLVV